MTSVLMGVKVGSCACDRQRDDVSRSAQETDSLVDDVRTGYRELGPHPSVDEWWREQQEAEGGW